MQRVKWIVRISLNEIGYQVPSNFEKKKKKKIPRAAYPILIPLNLDCELLHVLVVLDIVLDCLLDDLCSVLSVLLGPFSEQLFVSLFCLLL